jgi:hypothetical protein
MVGSPGGRKRVPERVALDDQRAIELLDGDSLSREHVRCPCLLGITETSYRTPASAVFSWYN